MGTSIGWLLGRFLLPNLAIVTIGLAIGILQAVILRDQITNAWRWVLATTVGWSIPGLILLFLNPSGTDFVNGVLIGICLGTAQWLILRTEIYGAGWWIVMNIVAWTTALAYLSGIVLSGVMAGLITGTALALLLRNRKTPPPARNSPYLR